MTSLRLRVVFAALAVALAVPGALLVERALESVAVERAARERAVAERVFDEMERALSELLDAEEARPASDYEFASATSPLRVRPAGALALGWFQIEADGRVSAPAWSPRAASLGTEIALDGARLEAAPAPPSGRLARAAGAAGPAREKVAAPKREAPASSFAPPLPGAAAPAVQAPPSSEHAAHAAAGGSDSPATPAATQAEERDAYAALAKLNTGAKEREERKQRVYVEEQVAQDTGPRAPALATGSVGRAARASDAAASDERARSAAIVAHAMATDATAPEWSEPAPAAGTLEATPHGAPSASAADTAPAAELAPGAPSEQAAPASDRKDARASADTPALPQSAPAGDAAAAPLAASSTAASAAGVPQEPGASEALVRVVVDPLRGRLARSGELLLVRSAWIGSRGVRQGVAFEPAALERLLGARVLAQAELSAAALRLSSATALAGPAPPGRRTFAHRFGEPFDPLGAELSFAPFDDAGARSVYWLAALFSLAGAGGLYAAYRTTAVALHFAERRSNFAAAVSHELKTPLTAIRLYAEMLRDGLVAGEERRREYYGSITAETERLSRLINNVLEFSRLERGARSFEPSVGDPTPAVREAVELLRPHAAAHGLALELTVDEALPPVRFERDALVQVVFNLVDNAVKYGRGEPARIEVACRRAGEGVAVIVRDHGPGVPRAELARILEPFYRRGDELTRSAPGAGIGLALVRSLAQQMGAALSVSNADGGGLAVSLTLPSGAVR